MRRDLSFTDVQKKLLVSPYLGIGAVSFLVAAGIVIHTAINSIYSEIQIAFAENLIGLICLFIGITSIIVILVLTAIIFEKKRKEIIITIILLSLFIIFEFIRSLYSGVENLSIGFSIVFIIIYGILRGIAFHRANKALKITSPGYGTGALGAFGWSYLIMGSLSVILAAIGVVIFSSGLIIFAAWVLTSLYIVQGICYLVIGMRFIQYIFTSPTITGFVTKSIGRTPITKATTPVLSEPQHFPQHESIPEKTISDEFETAVEFCGNCGAEIRGDIKICQICGEARV